MPSQNSISFTDESCSITRKNRDYFMGRARVRDFRTSWWCIRNRTSERSERVSFLIQTTSVKIPHKPPAHEVIYLFYMYWVNISSFYLWKLLFIEKKWPANLRNQGQLKPNTIYWLKTVYDDYNMNAKMTPKTPTSTINKKALTKNCHWNGTAGGLSSSDESRTRLMRF